MMISDPYKVLGIDSNASDEELKQTYRELSKKYHPDANPGNREAAEERFKEVQEAYRQIVEARQRGTSAYGYQSQQQGNTYGNGGTYADYEDIFGEYGAFGDFFRQWQSQTYTQQANTANEPLEFKAAANYINNGYYREALNALSSISSENRNAKWYYYSAIANSGIGNNATAVEQAKKAADMEPGNPEYVNYLRSLTQGGTWYQERGSNYGPITFNTGWCLSLCAINAMCGLCFRPGC